MAADKKALSLWKNANKSLDNYKLFISRKEDKFVLTYLDLLYISNFKGGNASIHENEKEVNKKLHVYNKKLENFYAVFNGKKLNLLSYEETEDLITKTVQFVSLTLSDETGIYGFKVSYASALLHAYLPDLVPIVDRRVLISKLNAKTNSNDQVINMEQYIPQLIKAFQKELLQGETIRDLDKLYFQIAISKPKKSI